MFLTRLCEEYDGEEGDSPVDRATWYGDVNLSSFTMIFGFHLIQ